MVAAQGVDRGGETVEVEKKLWKELASQQQGGVCEVEGTELQC